MKTAALILAALTAGTVMAEEVMFNNEFMTDSNGKIMKWQPNAIAEYLPLGNISAKDGVLTMTSTGKAIHFVSQSSAPIKEGDTLRITLRASGKGKVGFGAYYYGKKPSSPNFDGYFCHGDYPHFAVSEEPKVFTKDLLVKKNPGSSKEVTITNAKIVLCIDKNADVKIDQLKAEIIPAK